MNDETEKKPVELTDEQLNAAAGGADESDKSQKGLCSICRKWYPVEEITYVKCCNNTKTVGLCKNHLSYKSAFERM